VGSGLLHFCIIPLVAVDGLKIIPPVTAVQILRLLTVVKTVFNEQSITSNIAEVFNSRHDRKNRYSGRKSVEHTRKDLRAWLALRFYLKSSQWVLQRYHWRTGYRLFREAGFLSILELKIH